MEFTKTQAENYLADRLKDVSGPFTLMGYVRLSNAEYIKLESQPSSENLRDLWASFRSSIEGEFDLTIQCGIDGPGYVAPIHSINSRLLDAAYRSK